MKILVVDDNIAVQEIIGEILFLEDYETEKAGSVSEAIEKVRAFRPDAIILDSNVNGESGYKVLDSLPADSLIRAIVLTKGREVLPKDSPFIFDSVQKPFKSTDIMEKVRALEAELPAVHKTKKFRFRFFSKQPKIEHVDEMPGLRFGKSYVIFESEPDTVYKVAWHFLSKGCDVLVVTSGKIKMITDRFRDGNGREVKVIGLSSKSRIGYVEMSKLGTLMGQIRTFTEEKEKPVVVFDSLEEIMEINGLNNIITMIYQIIHWDIKKASTLIVSTRDDSLTDKDKELFLHDMELYDPPQKNGE